MGNRASIRRAVSAVGLACVLLLLVGCAGDTYAPVSDRTARATGDTANGVYRVARGDTLYSIAFRHDVDHRTLARWNDIREPFTIYPGQELRLSPPASTSRTASSPPPAPREPATASRSPSAPPAPPPRPSAPASTGSSSTNGWVWPAPGDVLKRFSADADGKQGINIGGDEGAEIRAAAGGRVVYSGSGLVGYGNLVIIKHNDQYLTAYGYNRELLVDEGDMVDQGETIARMGRNGGQPMLHFELRRDGRAVDPVPLLPRSR